MITRVPASNSVRNAMWPDKVNYLKSEVVISHRVRRVSQEIVQALVSATSGAVFAVIILSLARRQRLSFRYTVGWLILGAMAILASLLLPVVEPVADLVKVTPAALLSIVAAIFLVTICVQLSISISGLQEQVRRLAEEHAALKLTLQEMDLREDQ